MAGSSSLAEKRTRFSAAIGFPGGKIEPGESPAECAARELHEEMHVRIEAGDVIADTVHDYGTKIVHLIAVRAILLDGHFTLHDHDEIRWVTVHEMDDYLFAPADECLLDKIREAYFKPNPQDPENQYSSGCFSVADSFRNNIDAVPVNDVFFFGQVFNRQSSAGSSSPITSRNYILAVRHSEW